MKPTPYKNTVKRHWLAAALALLELAACSSSKPPREPEDGVAADADLGDGSPVSDGTTDIDAPLGDTEVSSAGDAASGEFGDAADQLEYGNECGLPLDELFENVDALPYVNCHLFPISQLKDHDLRNLASNVIGTCLINEDSALRCCDPPGPLQFDAVTLPGTFSAVDIAGGGFLCGIEADGRIKCFGDLLGKTVLPPWGYYTDISCGAANCCALDEEQHVVCWGQCGDGICDVPEGTFRKVRCDEIQGAFAIRTDGTLVRWGYPWWIGADGDLPEGKYIDVATGYLWVCAITDAGELHCLDFTLGEDPQVGQFPPGWETAKFKEVSCRTSTTCALTIDGAVVCWSDLPNETAAAAPNPTPNLYPYPYPRTTVGKVSAIATGVPYACAELESGDVMCWGKILPWLNCPSL